MPRSTLPHRARGIESEHFVLQFLADKIVFVPKSGAKGEHYTLHAGSKSGVLDVHETQMSSGRSSQHRTLFAMRREDIPAALESLRPLLSALLALLRPLRLGWLKHRGIGIARGIDLISDLDIGPATRKHKGRLAIDPQLYKAHIFVPEFLEEIYDFPNGTFALFRRNRRVGIGFKATSPDGRVYLSWIKTRDLSRFGHDWQKKVMSTLQTLAIPSECYPGFPFLR